MELVKDMAWHGGVDQRVPDSHDAAGRHKMDWRDKKGWADQIGASSVERME
jgi:hypothetical protein